MTIKNISAKIISIGTTVLMPDMEMTATATVAHTPAISAMVRKGFLAVTGDTAAADTIEEGGYNTVLNKSGNEATEAEPKEKAKAIKKMNRGELDEACVSAGIEVAESDTIPTLQEKLIAKLQKG